MKENDLLQPDVGRGFLHVSNVFLFFFAIK